MPFMTRFGFLWRNLDGMGRDTSYLIAFAGIVQVVQGVFGRLMWHKMHSLGYIDSRWEKYLIPI